MRIEYPIAIDNDYDVWRAFDNYFWPALYFADARGRIRHHHFGEREYQQSEMVLQSLLSIGVDEPPARTIRPFRVDIPDEALDDLRRRLAATRWPDRETVGDGSQGVRLERLRALVRYWAADYDWRAFETRLNALPQFVTEIGGLDVHLLQVPSRHVEALPLILTHGWPGSVVEMLKVIASGYSGYAAALTARPQAVGYGLTDSPAGLAAFVLWHPGFAQWSFGDDPGRSPTRDDVLDDVTLYWLTNSAASSGRLYWENLGASPTSAAAMRTGEISVPVAVTVFPEEVYRAPESWARRAYPTLAYFREVDRGGHFAAWEQPQLFTEELRAAFRSLR
jgi:hypothetical protein